MTQLPSTAVVVLHRVGVAYTAPGEAPASPSKLFFKALADLFPPGKPPRFRQHGIAFALPEEWRADEPPGSSEGETWAVTEVAATNIAFRCRSTCTAIERRYGVDAGTQTVMSALRTMATDPSLDAFVVVAVDGSGPSNQTKSQVPVAAALMLTRAGTPEDEVRVLGVHEVQHWATRLLDRALSRAIGGALEKAGATMVDIDAVVVSLSGSLTVEEVNTVARTLCAPLAWDGKVHTQDDFAGPLCAAAGAFDLAFEAMLLRYYAKHGQLFLWVSRTSSATCVAVLRQDGGLDAE